MVKGIVRDVVKLVVPADAERMKLVVVADPDQPLEIDVDQKTGFTNGDNGLELIGLSGNDSVTTATIEVHVLDAEGSGTVNIAFDTFSDNFVAARDDRVEPEEYDTIANAPSDQSGRARLFLAANSGVANDDAIPIDQRKYARGDTPPGKPYCFVFTKTGVNNDLIAELNSAHELGHVLGLTAVLPAAAGQHDSGPFPSQTSDTFGGPMHAGTGTDQPGLWLAHEDWRAANNKAKEFQP